MKVQTTVSRSTDNLSMLIVRFPNLSLRRLSRNHQKRIADLIIFTDGEGTEGGSASGVFSSNPIMELVEILEKTAPTFHTNLLLRQSRGVICIAVGVELPALIVKSLRLYPLNETCVCQGI